MDFSTFHSKAWDDHVSVAREVAQRLSEGVPLVTTESQLTQLANLARLRFRFDRHSMGRLRLLIDLINREGG